MKKIIFLFSYFLSFNLIAQSPNFVLILADDLGWNGTSVQVDPTIFRSKSDFYETPNLEQLASEGITFSAAYSPAAKCSPTRNSILTGETPPRNSFTETGSGATPDEILISGTNISNIDTEDLTIAEWLGTTNLDYRRAHFGKWHLTSGGPSNNGFTADDGNTDNAAGDADDGQVIQTDPKKMFDLTEKGISFMQEAVTANEPFYLQLSHYAVHTAVETTQAAQDYFTTKPPGNIHDNIDYAGMTRDLDESIGILLAEIENLGIAENTYIIFTSDNGGQLTETTNTPLYRGKSFLTEGGIRVPMIIRGPNIPAGVTSPEPVVGYDLYPTIAEWTQSDAPLPSTLDGQSLKDLVLQNEFIREEPLYFHSPHYGNFMKTPSSVARMGDFKLMINYESGEDMLFDFSEGVNENQLPNLADTNPDLLLEMKIKLRDYLKSVNGNMPSLNPDHEMFSGTETDVDADGLEDEWEFRELLSWHYGPNDDPDGDGLNNLAEYEANSDPLVAETVHVENLAKADFPSLIKLFPNPASSDLWLEFLEPSSLFNTIVDIRIYNHKGQLVREIEETKEAVMRIRISDLAIGNYTLEVLENGVSISMASFMIAK